MYTPTSLYCAIGHLCVTVTNANYRLNAPPFSKCRRTKENTKKKLEEEKVKLLGSEVGKERLPRADGWFRETQSQTALGASGEHGEIDEVILIGVLLKIK